MKEDRIMTFLGALVGFNAILMFTVGKFLFGGIFCLIAFGIFWNRGFGKQNDRLIYENIVKTEITIEELYAKIKDMETPLGKPWIAGHRGFAGDSIVFGPTAFKDCVVISRKKDYLNIKHITLVDNIIRKPEDEYRFKVFVNKEKAEVSPKRYAIFASYNLASVLLIRELRDMIENISDNKAVRIEDRLYKFYYHNSLEGFLKDVNGNDILRVENSYHPFVARVLDEEGAEMASIMPRSFNGKGIVFDSAGYDILANGEHYGDISRAKRNGRDTFTVNTDEGSFEVEIFPACTRANVSCNYMVKQDGKLKAVIGGSPNIVFDEGGKSQSDIILSYDDDYLVLYAVLEIFIMTLNRKYLK